MLIEQGDVNGALSAYHASLAIRERLAAADPQNTGWQRDLATCYSRCAILCREQQDQAGVMEYFQKCFAVLDGMRRRGMHLDPAAAQLYQQLAPMFGQM